MNGTVSVKQSVKTAPSVQGAVKKRSWLKAVKLHVRRIAIEMLNLLINHDLLFWLVGVINKRIDLIESVFLVYPANEKYALAYVYPCRLPKVKWNPIPGGLLWQNGKLTVMFMISATNGQFTDPQNTENLRRMSDRMERLRRLFGARRKTFAGIVPGVLCSRRIIREAPEADLTAQAVRQAIDSVKAEESLGDEVPIIVLGGRGFIGRRVVKLLETSNVFSIDSSDGQGSKDWPDHLHGRRVIVINITLNNALKDYLDVIWPGTVVINEVYPEPNSAILERLKNNGCSCYHVVGVGANSIPSFPAAYHGAIPCCAAWPSPEMKVVVRRIV